MTGLQLDRSLQFRRAPVTDDGFSSVARWTAADPAADNLGQPVWASRQDVSDGERAVAGTVYAEVSARFRVRASAFTRAITPKDRLVERDRVFAILGIKEIGTALLEITATARLDL